MRVCVRACVHACVRVRACVHACVRVRACVQIPLQVECVMLVLHFLIVSNLMFVNVYLYNLQLI